MARDEVNQLLQQRDEWNEVKITLDQTISDYKNHTDELNNQLLERDHVILNRTEELATIRQELASAYQQSEDRNANIAQLQAEIAAMKESEAQLNDTLRKTRVALTREKTRVQLYENVGPATALGAPGPGPEQTPSSAAPTAPTMTPTDAAVVTNAEVRAGSPSLGDRLASPYVLQTDLLRDAVEAGRREITDLDDDDAPPAAMRSLVPSVTRQAEIETITAGLEVEHERTDVGIKHMVNSLADKEGAIGLINVMQEMHDVRNSAIIYPFHSILHSRYLLLACRTNVFCGGELGPCAN